MSRIPCAEHPASAILRRDIQPAEFRKVVNPAGEAVTHLCDANVLRGSADATQVINAGGQYCIRSIRERGR